MDSFFSACRTLFFFFFVSSSGRAISITQPSESYTPPIQDPLHSFQSFVTYAFIIHHHYPHSTFYPLTITPRDEVDRLLSSCRVLSRFYFILSFYTTFFSRSSRRQSWARCVAASIIFFLVPPCRPYRPSSSPPPLHIFTCTFVSYFIPSISSCCSNPLRTHNGPLSFTNHPPPQRPKGLASLPPYRNQRSYN